jgi:hypothetical protein
MLNIVYLAIREENPPSSYYDHGLISHLFDNFPHERFEVRAMPDGLDGAVVVIPARNQAEDIDQINVELNKLRWAVIILTGDEESMFPIEKISHPNFRVWVMSPKQGRHDSESNRIGSGFRVEEPVINAQWDNPVRDLNFFFSGQITHEQRQLMAKQLRNMKDGELFEQPGFAQGMALPDYLAYMRRAKFAPAPCGPVSPDNFRLYEALECGTVPIADGGDFWTYLFGESVPFPVISNWANLPLLMPTLLNEWPTVANKTFAWWILYKRRMADKLEDNIKEISGQPVDLRKDSEITVLMPTSCIPSHPSTEMIEKTIASVRERLPNSEIIIMIDGLRPDMAERKNDYDEYIRALLWKINNKYRNITPVLMNSYSHQSGMTKEALKLVRTPLILFVEHDTPLVNETPFDELSAVLLAGYAKTIRLSHEDRILPDHQYLMLDDKPQMVHGVPLVRSRQWSQRPHLSTTEYYRHIIGLYCDDQPRFVEHVMYGILVHDDWNRHMYHIYHPKGSILRSSNLNGRDYQVEKK